MITTSLAILKTPTGCHHRARRFIISAFVDAAILWLAILALELYTLHHLAAGERFVFAPRGIGLAIDAFDHVALFTGMFVIYTLPSFWVRPWLGWTFRALMFGLFVIFLTFMILTKIIAIIETPDHKMVFYRYRPFPPRAYDPPPNAELHRTTAITSISFITGVPDDLVVYPVSRFDTAGQGDIERLRKHIHIVKSDP